jgi:hypothetical protein
MEKGVDSMTEQRIDENKLTEGLCDTPETCKPGKGGMSEDWLAVWIGLTIFVLSLGVFVGWDILGWGVTTGIWTSLENALNPVSATYKGLGGLGALIVWAHSSSPTSH